MTRKSHDSADFSHSTESWIRVRRTRKLKIGRSFTATSALRYIYYECTNNKGSHRITNGSKNRKFTGWIEDFKLWNWSLFQLVEWLARISVEIIHRPTSKVFVDWASFWAPKIEIHWWSIWTEFWIYLKDTPFSHISRRISGHSISSESSPLRKWCKGILEHVFIWKNEKIKISHAFKWFFVILK